MSANLRLLLLLIISAAPFAAQTIHPVSGRRIAGVMGFGGADWLVREERMREERPDLAVKLLELQPGMAVADVGAGVGYYTGLLAERVAPSGKVYATDIQPKMLEALRKNMTAAGITNVVPLLSTESDAKLPPAAIDVILLVDVYHEFSEPQKMLAGLRAALKPDGRLILLEFRKEDPKVPIREEHKMSIEEARAELEAEGFRLDKVRNELPWQHVLIFRKVR
jgi:protein-L-isoaspartate O-methyltransferase